MIIRVRTSARTLGVVSFGADHYLKETSLSLLFGPDQSFLKLICVGTDLKRK